MRNCRVLYIFIQYILYNKVHLFIFSFENVQCNNLNLNMIYYVENKNLYHDMFMVKYVTVLGYPPLSRLVA